MSASFFFPAVKQILFYIYIYSHNKNNFARNFVGPTHGTRRGVKPSWRSGLSWALIRAPQESQFQGFEGSVGPGKSKYNLDWSTWAHHRSVLVSKAACQIAQIFFPFSFYFLIFFFGLREISGPGKNQMRSDGSLSFLNCPVA